MEREKLTFDSENKLGKCPGVLQGNVHQTKKGLVVIEEWWGMNEQIQMEAQQIGSQGHFVTLVPDLYRGKVGTNNEEARHLMDNLDWVGAVADIRGAAKLLLARGCTSVGVTGFCMGGALTLAAAALVPEITAAAPFYGIPAATLADVSKIKIPVQGHYAEQDTHIGFSSPQDVKALEEKLKAGGVSYELYTYPAAHGFTNSTRPNYNAEATKTAFARLFEFMNKNLK